MRVSFKRKDYYVLTFIEKSAEISRDSSTTVETLPSENELHRFGDYKHYSILLWPYL